MMAKTLNTRLPQEELGLFVFFSLLLGTDTDCFVRTPIRNDTSLRQALKCTPLASLTCTQAGRESSALSGWVLLPLGPTSAWCRAKNYSLHSSDLGPSSTSKSPAASRIAPSSGPCRRQSESGSRGTRGLSHWHRYSPGGWNGSLGCRTTAAEITVIK